MDSSLLYNLYKLHQIDSAIADIKRKAAAFDPGREQFKRLKEARDNWEIKQAAVNELNKELGELEAKQAFYDERLKKINIESYKSGVSSRDLEAFQKEIPHVKAQQSENDSKILEMWEKLPPLKEIAESAKKILVQAKKEFDDYQEVLKKKKEVLETDYREKVQMRPQFEEKVDPQLLRQYNNIKSGTGDTGMALVHNNTCSACNMLLAERIIENVKEGKVVTCPSCHRILFKLNLED